MSGTVSAPSTLLLAALREASGLPGAQAVQVLGHRSGTVYVKDGYITGADSSGTPDIRTRLTRSGLGDDGAGRTGTGAPEALRENVRRRIASGEIDLAEVGAVALSAILDAVWDLSRQAALTPPRLRLEPGRQSTHGIDHRISLDDLLTAVGERTDRAATLAVGPDHAVDLAPLRGSGVVLDDDEWRIVGHANGRRTLRDIAWATGSELFATLTIADGLADAGLLSITRRPATADATDAHPATRAEPAPASSQAFSVVIVPQRRPETSPHGLAVALTPPEWATDLAEASADDPDVIQRLITGLRAMG